jgi:heme-degrading monooxygenase HmoA
MPTVGSIPDRPAHRDVRRDPLIRRCPAGTDTESNMYVVINRVPVAKDWHDAFEQRFLERAGQVELQPGFVRMEIMRPETEDTPYLVQTAWKDRAAFEAWLKSDDFKVAHQNPLPKEAFSGEGRLETFEVIIYAEPE